MLKSILLANVVSCEIDFLICVDEIDDKVFFLFC